MTMYTLAVIAGLIVVLLLDRLLKTQVIRPNPRFVYTSLVFLVFQLLFDNYFTLQGLWIFNQSETIEVFIPYIPIENVLFGLELLWFTLIWYSFLSRENAVK